jgi:hypothetical protein
LTNPADFPFWIMVGGLAVLIWQRCRSLRTWEPLFLTVGSALTLVLALRSTRNFGTFILCAVPTAGTLLANSGPQTAPTFVAASRTRPVVFVASALIFAAFIAYAWWLPLPRLAWNPMSDTMKNAIAACDGPLYNRYDEGGYIIWFLKGRPVFMDSRQDPFPEEMVLDQIRLEATGDYEETFGRYAIRCALVLEGSPLSQRLASDGWHAHPAGPGWIVYSASDRSDEKSENALGHGAGTQPNRSGGGV